MELLALPAVVGMVVALGALNLNAEKDPRHLGGGLFGAAILGHDDRGMAILAHIAAGGDKVAGNLVPAGILVELIRQVGDHRVSSDAGAIFLCSIKHHVAPVAGPVLTVVRIFKQPLDELLALVVGGIEQKGECRLGRGNVADDVEIGPAEERLIIAALPHVGRFVEHLVGDRPIDPPGDLRDRRRSQHRRAERQ